ncbi:enoyl-CoA hydratase-related protein [Spirillospora sp. NPDC047279]|uniref:enoyl-CoA hydratase/isomerase family protein n=1 Tax=Spirillospora sp. NPDC047279 TaxID=3155478 RepID=UPI0033CC1193
MNVDLRLTDAVATVRLDRPEAGNALNDALKTDLLAVLQKVADDPGVRAVILTGAGSTFTVGQDLRELKAHPETADGTVERHYNPITLLLATMPKPVVAAVNGTCVGAGLGFALACDLHVWSSRATLSTAFHKVGLTCDSGLSSTLARSVGLARAASLIHLAEPFSIQQAITWGFAGEVVEPLEVEPVAAKLARRLAAGPTRAFAASKRLLARPLAEALEAEALEQNALAATHDHTAAVAAFLAREEPVFRGR